METVERVRLKAASNIARDRQLPPEAEGTVICRYQMLTRVLPHTVRLDVRFGNQVIWGGPAEEFEAVRVEPKALAS